MSDTLPDQNIKHVVVLMLENRGFDHIMGWLYPEDPEAPADYKVVGRPGDFRRFQSLCSMDPAEVADLANPLPKRFSQTGQTLPINKGARTPRTPSYNTGESFAHIFNQMWGVGYDGAVWKDPDQRMAALQQLKAKGPAPMNGYVLDYDLDVLHHTKQELAIDQLSETLDTYLPEQMPVLSGLARSYAVSDEWFCSVPSQTNTNRAFSFTGTSRGMVDNSFYDPPNWNPWLKTVLASGNALSFLQHYGYRIFNPALKKDSPAHYLSNADELPVSTRSLFEVLQSEGFSWKVYWQSQWPPPSWTGTGLIPGSFTELTWQYTRTMIPLLQSKQFDANFVQFDASDQLNSFYKAARDGKLPAVSWIEPKWGGGAQWNTQARIAGNDYHPVSDTTLGEDFVMDVYNALSAGRNWENTLLIITFDENGGTYDHVVPPAATPPGNESCPLPHAPVERDDLHEVIGEPGVRTQYGFDFAQYGVRVPTILVSPQVPAKTIFRSLTDKPFDHASIIATILKLAKVDPSRWQLGGRVDQAPTFEHMFSPELRLELGQGGPNRPKAPFSLPDGRDEDAPAAIYSQPYVLEYVGSSWPEGAPASKPLYLAKGKAGSFFAGSYVYPTLTDTRSDAVPFTFEALNGGSQGAQIGNMSLLRIATTEERSNRVLTAAQRLPSVVFFGSGQGEGSQWQVRILSSRHQGDTVRVGDLVYFVSQLKPGLGQDPMQRLTPYPDDPLYVTTLAGEWALWRIALAPETV